MLIEETGVLPIGVFYDGSLCREYVLRPMRVRDSLTARKMPDTEMAADDDELMGLLSYAVRLEIEGVPKEAMSLNLMLDMFDEDLSEILAADRRLKEQIARFRSKSSQTIDVGSSEDRDSVGDSKPDESGGGHSLA